MNNSRSTRQQVSRPLNVGVVGATGLVGEVFLRLLVERNFPVAELRLFASQNSVGMTQNFKSQVVKVQSLDTNSFENLDLVFFSSGDEISNEWAPLAVKQGAYAIDNSAAFRLHAGVPLVVPEVNGEELNRLQGPSLIANPNCSTIQLVMALKPLADQFGLEDVRVASYQAISGAGKPGQDEMFQQLRHHPLDSSISVLPTTAFPRPIALNCIPQIGSFNDEGFCSEEVKIQKETKKILNLPDLRVSAWTVRIPALNGHSEAVWVTCKSEVQKSEMIFALKSFSGLEVYAEDMNYPTPLEVSGTNPVHIGRVHRSADDPKTWMLWIVADNLRKGAALNGVQIAERIFS